MSADIDALTCALQRQPGQVTDEDRNELSKFVAALHAVRNGMPTRQAFELVYGDEAAASEVDA